MLVDAGELPLDLRRQSLLVRYWYRIQRIPDSLTCKTIFNDRYFNIYDKYSSFPKPFGYRVLNLLDEFDIPRIKIQPIKYSAVPPWRLPSAKHCRYFTGTKQDLSDEMIRLTFLEHVEEQSDSILVFTDGSKSDAGVGFGVVFPNFSRSGRLPNQASIFTAESFAILTALKEIASHPRENYVLFSDSKSALQAVEHFNTAHPIILAILEWIYLIESRGCNISLCWSPAHVGIEGNERADSLAKSATSNTSVVNCPLPASDMFAVIKSAVSDAWQFCWELENQKMKEITNSIHPWKYFQLSRRYEVVLSRLRIGHTKLTHSFLMNRSPQPFCDDCLVPLTVRHIIIECPSYIHERGKYFSNCKDGEGNYSLSKILGFNFKVNNLFRYIEEIGILSKI